MVHHTCRLHRQHFETSSLLETTGWIEVKFYVKPPWDGGTKFVHVVWVTGPFMVVVELLFYVHGKHLR